MSDFHSEVIVLLVLFHCCFCYKVTRLNSENFEEHVFLDNDPWIIGINRKASERVLERIYEQVKDRIRVGCIDQEDLTSYSNNQVRFNFKISLLLFHAIVHSILNT